MPIELRNGHQFNVCCASGALGFIGDGYWWEQPLRKLGLIQPAQLTLITKTLTFNPRVGNLKGWCPWRCVRLLPGGNTVNAVGLTNPGFFWWTTACYHRVMEKGYDVILSLGPESERESEIMAIYLSTHCQGLKGVELNVSCPNVEHDDGVEHVVRIVEAFLKSSTHPVIIKLGVQNPYLDICKSLDGKVDAFDLINAVPWQTVFPGQPSPLSKYGLVGAVSGPVIAPFARDALASVKNAGVKTPIISGGGITGLEEIRNRPADAFSIGTLFLHRPWKPKSVVRELRDAGE